MMSVVLDFDQLPVRVSGRVILLDPTGHVLVLLHRTGAADSVWATPGGRCEDGETPAQAARRELAEECSVVVALPPGQAADYSESRRVLLRGITYHQRDRFFLVRVVDRPPVMLESDRRQEASNVLDYRWVSASDLRGCAARYEPLALPDLIDRAIGTGR
ncbi:MAG: hypothetical protein JWN95_792 [Frankiales bacterium]|nr:hypothetical protein [Frankiales bacterium]